MSASFSAHYDGHAIVPDEPVSLPIGQTLQVRVVATPGQVGQFQNLTQFAAELPESPGDLSARHDHYLYGAPKK
jgi:hypothetical protein